MMITWGILRNDSEMAYNPHHTHIFQNNFLGVEVGRISVIVDSMESILLVLTEQFHTPLSIEPKPPYTSHLTTQWHTCPVLSLILYPHFYKAVNTLGLEKFALLSFKSGQASESTFVIWIPITSAQNGYNL